MATNDSISSLRAMPQDVACLDAHEFTGYIETDLEFVVAFASANLIHFFPDIRQPQVLLLDYLSGQDRSAALEWCQAHVSSELRISLTDSTGAKFLGTLSKVEDRIGVLLKRAAPPEKPTIERVELTRLLDLTLEAACAFTLDGVVYSSNERWSKLFGTEVLHQTLPHMIQQISADLPRDFTELANSLRSSMNVIEGQDWLTAPSGGRHWIHWRLRLAEESRIIFVFASDETAAKNRALKEEEEQKEFEAMYGNASIGVCHTDLHGRYVRVNDGFCRIVGYTADELLGMSFTDITHPDDVNADLSQSALLLSGDIDRFCMEKRYILKNGQTVWAYLTESVIRDESGCPKMFMSAIGDITSKSRSHSPLKGSEQFYRTWIDPNERTYWMADPNGVILDLSSNGGLTTGVGPEGLLRQGWRDLVHPEDKARVLAAWDRATSNGTRYQCEYRVKVIDGGYHWIRSHAHPERDSEGQILCWFGCTDDIQIQKFTEDHLATLVEERTLELMQANEALREARDTALAASLAKSQFLANMSHEIRTPMNGVIGIASLLREQPLNAKCQAMVEIICQRSEALIRIIGDILEFSKLEAGKVVLDSTPTDVVELISEITALFKAHARAKQVELVFESKHPVLPLLIVDPFRLRQVLSNLVSNAVKFTSVGSVGVRLQGSPTEFGFDIVIEIRDTGIGIPAERLDSVFESFTQVDGSTQRKYGGSGLGLTICKNLVALMGGTITASSEIGVGTTMTVRLPLAIAESTDPPNPSASA